MKVNVTINDDLLKKIDEYCDEHYLPRSTFLGIAADTYINQQTIMDVMPRLMQIVEKEGLVK